MTTSLFSQQQPQHLQQQPALFGGIAAPQTAGLGLQKQAGGLFGAPAAAGGGLFGGGASQGAQGQGSLFGAANNSANQKQQSLFGQPGAGLSLGAPGGTQQTNQGSAGLFGQPAAQQNVGGGGLFGSTGGAATQASTGGGLFGNTQQNSSLQQLAGMAAPAQNAAAPGGGLFGAPGQAAGGLFGQPQQNSQLGQTAGQPGGGLFGAQPTLGLQKQATGFFGQGQHPQNNQQQQNFGQPQGGLFQPGQQSALGQLGYATAPGISQYGIQAPPGMGGPSVGIPSINQAFISEPFVKQREEIERQQHEKEIVRMFENYSNLLACDPSSAENRFVSTFYNRYPKQLTQNDPQGKAQIQFFKDHVPKTVTFHREVEEVVQPQEQQLVQGSLQQQQTRKVVRPFEVPINLDLWLKSYQNNPDPGQLYTTQINSTQELLERCKQIAGTTDDVKVGTSGHGVGGANKGEIAKDSQAGQAQHAGAVEKASQKLEQTIGQLQHISDKHEATMQDNLLACQQNNQVIRRQMLRIFGKFEQLMHVEGRASLNGQDAQKRDALIQAQRQLIERLNDPRRSSGGGLLTKLRDMQSHLQYSLAHQDEVSSRGANRDDDLSAIPLEEKELALTRQQSFPDEQAEEADLGHMFKVLRKQKRALDTMVESVNTSTRQLMVMEREMDMIQGGAKNAF